MSGVELSTNTIGQEGYQQSSRYWWDFKGRNRFCFGGLCVTGYMPHYIIFGMFGLVTVIFPI